MPICSNPLFPHAYTTHYHGYTLHDESNGLRYFTFAFKTAKGCRYIVEIEEFHHNVFILKFHPSTHSGAYNRYNILTGEGDSFRIISTCLNVLSFVKTSIEDKVSFGFMGARDEIKETSNENTQSFRIYARAGKRYFNP